MTELGIQPNLWRCANTPILSALGTSCEMLAGGGVTGIGGNVPTVLEDVFEEWPHTLSTWKTERQTEEQRWESGDVLFIRDDVSVCFVFVINETLMEKQTVTDHIKAMNEWIRQKIRDRVCVSGSGFAYIMGIKCSHKQSKTWNKLHVGKQPTISKRKTA